jgi:hypothetical protein
MRLTVGPLPAAIYWRRRLLVLGALLLIVLGIVYACTGGPGAGNQAGPGPSNTTTTAPASATTTGTPTPTPTATPTPTPFTLPAEPTGPAGGTGGGEQTGPCTDGEIGLTVAASSATLTMGQAATFTLTIENISTRTCTRDIGSEQQELQLRLNGVIAWSSDDCGGRDSFEEELPPEFHRSFPIEWNGYRSRTGTGEAPSCPLEPSAQAKPDAGTYELVARLGSKFSTPVSVVISSSGAGS